MVYKHDKERIDLPPPQTRIEMELLAKEVKTINNSIPRVITGNDR